MVILAVVVVMMAILGIIAAAFSFATASRALVARKQLAVERAMYLAEAGAEMAAAHIAGGGATPAVLEDELGSGRYRTTIGLTNIVGAARRTFVVRSVGTVQGMSHVVRIDGLRHKTWAKYALWSHNNREIYFKAGEKFYGAVHANNMLWFSGDPEFFAPVTSAASTYGGSIEDAIFHEGFALNVPTDTMASVDFDHLKNESALVLTGPTRIVFQGTNMMVRNAARGWDNEVMALPPNSVIYVKEEPGETGSVVVNGTVDGRTTVVAERDIHIVGELLYAADPKTSESDDALGLISGRDIRVERWFPDNGQIYAHMMATGKATPNVDTDGSFGVVDYWERHPSGFLTVHGGIVQHYRGAVGTIRGTRLLSGFEKKYTYDTRFAIDPPPEYPPLSNEFTWGTWRHGAPNVR